MSVGGSGRRLVYAVAGPGGRSVQWTAYALDLSDGSRSTLATVELGVVGNAARGGGRSRSVPVADLRAGSSGASHGPVSAVDLRTGARRTVFRDLPGVLRADARRRQGWCTGRRQGPARPSTRGSSTRSSCGRARDALPAVRDPRRAPSNIVADDTTAAWQTNDGPDAGVWAAPLDGQGPARQFYRGGSGDRAVRAPRVRGPRRRRRRSRAASVPAGRGPRRGRRRRARRVRLDRGRGCPARLHRAARRPRRAARRRAPHHPRGRHRDGAQPGGREGPLRAQAGTGAWIRPPTAATGARSGTPEPSRRGLARAARPRRRWPRPPAAARRRPRRAPGCPRP